jgi:hypothetical protein
MKDGHTEVHDWSASPCMCFRLVSGKVFDSKSDVKFEIEIQAASGTEKRCPFEGAAYGERKGNLIMCVASL